MSILPNGLPPFYPGKDMTIEEFQSLHRSPLRPKPRADPLISFCMNQQKRKRRLPKEKQPENKSVARTYINKA